MKFRLLKYRFLATYFSWLKNLNRIYYFPRYIFLWTWRIYVCCLNFMKFRQNNTLNYRMCWWLIKKKFLDTSDVVHVLCWTAPCRSCHPRKRSLLSSSLKPPRCERVGLLATALSWIWKQRYFAYLTYLHIWHNLIFDFTAKVSLPQLF